MRQMIRQRREFFKAHPQIRKFFAEEELRRLADSLLAMGQLSPILAWVDGLIIDGQRRWLAAEMAGIEELDAIITDEPIGEMDMAEIQLVTAIHRADLEAYDKYLGIKKLLSLKPQTLKEVAERLCIDPSGLTRLMSIEKCVTDVQQAFAEGKIKDVSSVYAISRLPLDQQIDALIMKLHGASRDELERKAKKEMKNQSDEPRTKKVKIAYQGGTAVLTGKDLGMSEVVEVLEGMLKEARKAVGVYDVSTFQRMMRDKYSPNGTDTVLKGGFTQGE